MRASTQFHWIAEAEARSLRESALSHRARREPPIGVVWIPRRSLWPALWPRLIARLTPGQPVQVAWRSSRRRRD